MEHAPAVEKTILVPRSRWQPIELRELWRYRGLLWMLSLREIQVRYKQRSWASLGR